jgi:hypothetical protein
MRARHAWGGIKRFTPSFRIRSWSHKTETASRAESRWSRNSRCTGKGAEESFAGLDKSRKASMSSQRKNQSSRPLLQFRVRETADYPSENSPDHRYPHAKWASSQVRANPSDRINRRKEWKFMESDQNSNSQCRQFFSTGDWNSQWFHDFLVEQSFCQCTWT